MELARHRPTTRRRFPALLSDPAFNPADRIGGDQRGAGLGLGRRPDMRRNAATAASVAKAERSAPARGARVPLADSTNTAPARTATSSSTSPSAGEMPKRPRSRAAT